MPLAVAPFSLGFAALTASSLAILLALHFLRAQPTVRAASTLLFWRAATRSVSANVLRSSRFSRWKTFALLATILSLIAAALTADRWNNAGGKNGQLTVLVIDAGAAMADQDGSTHTLLQKAVDAASSDIRRASVVPTIIAAAAQPTVLSSGDEPAVLAIRRLQALAATPEATASALALQLAGTVQESGDGKIGWYTAQDELPPGLPEGVARRVIIHRIALKEAAAIVGVRLVPESDPAHGSLRISIAGRTSAPFRVEAQIEGEPSMARSAGLVTGRTEVVFEKMIADGRAVECHLHDAPGPASSHAAIFQLPDKRPLTFRFLGDVPMALRAIASAAGRETPDGQIAIVSAGSSIPIDATSAIVVVDDDNQSAGSREVLKFAAGGQQLSLDGATARMSGTMLPQGDPVLYAGAKPVITFQKRPDKNVVYICAGLLGANAELPKVAAYPVLMNRLFNELVGRRAEPVTVSRLRNALDPLWPMPNDHSFKSRVTVADAPPIPLKTRANESQVSPSAVAVAFIDWTEVVLGLALVLLLIEGSLLAARKIV